MTEGWAEVWTRMRYEDTHSHLIASEGEAPLGVHAKYAEGFDAIITDKGQRSREVSVREDAMKRCGERQSQTTAACGLNRRRSCQAT